jgi:hypothetical protein
MTPVYPSLDFSQFQVKGGMRRSSREKRSSSRFATEEYDLGDGTNPEETPQTKRSRVLATKAADQSRHRDAQTSGERRGRQHANAESHRMSRANAGADTTERHQRNDAESHRMSRANAGADTTERHQRNNAESHRMSRANAGADTTERHQRNDAESHRISRDVRRRTQSPLAIQHRLAASADRHRAGYPAQQRY